MFRKRDYNKISFAGVGIALILFGAVICGAALSAWILQWFGISYVCYSPFSKVMGGVIVLGIGYIILEMELLRRK